MSAEPTHPTQLGFGIPAHGIKTKTALQRTKPHPLPSWRTRIRHLLRSWDTLLVIASRHREASFRENGRCDQFMTDLCKICFKKNHRNAHQQRLERRTARHGNCRKICDSSKRGWSHRFTHATSRNNLPSTCSATMRNTAPSPSMRSKTPTTASSASTTQYIISVPRWRTWARNGSLLAGWRLWLRRCGEKCDGIAYFIGILGKVSGKLFIFADYAKEKMTQVKTCSLALAASPS